MNTIKVAGIALLASALVACGGNSSSDGNGSTSTPNSSSVAAVSSQGGNSSVDQSSINASSSDQSSDVSSAPSSQTGNSSAGTEPNTSSSSAPASSSGASSSAPTTESPAMGEGGLLSCIDANTVQGFASMDGGTTGGAGGTYVVAKTGADIVAALASKKRNPTPITIYINGTITPANSGTNQFDVKDMENVSIIGVGEAALFDGIGINIVRASNIIIRNITVRHVVIGQKDHISIDKESRNVWIDHNRFYNSLDFGKNHFDELVSGKGDIDNITISYNHFHDSWKTSLWGSGDGNDYHRRISYIGNYWERVNSRLPLFRFGEGHILNNYYSQARESGINSRMGAHIRVEANHFEDSKNVLISMDSSTHGYWNPSDNVLKNIEWGAYPSGNCTSSKGCVWGGQPGTTQTGGDFSVYANAKANSNEPGGEVTVSTYEPPYAQGYVILPAVYDYGNDEIKTYVLANAGVNKISRECLGIPEDIIEGESGGGSAPGTGGGDIGGGDDDEVESGSAEGGWNVVAMRMAGGHDKTSGSVSNSTENTITATFNGGKMESSKEGFFYVYKLASGDVTFTANLSAITAATRDNNQGAVGIALCIECENGSSTVAATAKIGVVNISSGTWGIIGEHRLTPGASRAGANYNNDVSPKDVVVNDDLYFRMVLTGNTYTSFYSVDGGNSWTQKNTGTFSVDMPDDVQVGIYAAQGNDNANGFTAKNIVIEMLDD